MKKNLTTLLESLTDFQIYGRELVEVTGIIVNSRLVKKGNLFVAIKGEKHDSHNYIPDAIGKGAVVVVGERNPQKNWFKKATYIKVSKSRHVLSLITSAWYDHPSKKLKVIGVTGTDGKTTTANLIYWILKNSRVKTGLISTIGAKIGDEEYDTGFHVTNPEPLQLQRFLAKMVEKKCKYVVLEVTSHGLDQDRVAGVDFDVAVLTNITHEHIDYHKTWKNYREAKTKLFKNTTSFVVLNKDDKSFNYISHVVPKKVRIISFGMKNRSDFKADKLDIVKSKMNFSIQNKDDTYILSSKLLGKYNAENILAAVACTRQLGVTWRVIKNSLNSFPSPKGRLEEIKNILGVKIFVDFAHTPNSLESVLTTLKKQKGKGARLISVFGCAGERDMKKRKLMPKISLSLADVSIFTAEDPRSEDILDILEVMAKAAKRAGGKEAKRKDYSRTDDGNNKDDIFFRIPERGVAISFAIQKLVRKGDTVVVCGKGHEKSLAYNGIEYPWSDQKAVRVALEGGVKKIKRK